MEKVPLLKSVASTLYDKKTQRELSPQEEAIVRSFDTIPFSYYSRLGEKVDLLLAWRGFKTAADIFLREDVTPEEIQKTKEVVESSGLLFMDSGVLTKSQFEPSRICFVSRNPADLRLISKVYFGDHVNDPAVFLEMGRMSGFPPSSVALFSEIHRKGVDSEEMQRKLALNEEDKKVLFTREEFAFATKFLMSKAHWQKEAETARDWAQEIKLTDPSLFENFIANSGR